MYKKLIKLIIKINKVELLKRKIIFIEILITTNPKINMIYLIL
jgi:hypothetical protein